MPELPEVEVTRRRIAPVLLGRRIARVNTTRPSYFFLTPPGKLRSALVGTTSTEIVRHGKYLVARLDSGAGLLLHLGMTGQLFTSDVHSPRLLRKTARAALAPGEQRGFQPDAHTHLMLEFDDGGPSLYFRDVRKFGKVRLLNEKLADPRLDRLGTDALAIEPAELYERTRDRKVPIKSVLLDQAVLAGVGNIYADEALYLAGVRPARAARRVTREECAALVRAVKRVLGRAIEAGGSSISDFVGPDGSDGHYQDERWVYSRTGERCRRCATPIRRLVIGQRSAHFCPQCQK
ncbi:MAG TPA: bifunctional DNA-formamidopyrimidine glycosylase/DNA-(apurinic or apyrimidinic site) lyase [Polyangiaceae bacterium]